VDPDPRYQRGWTTQLAAEDRPHELELEVAQRAALAVAVLTVGLVVGLLVRKGSWAIDPDLIMLPLALFVASAGLLIGYVTPGNWQGNQWATPAAWVLVGVTLGLTSLAVATHRSQLGRRATVAAIAVGVCTVLFTAMLPVWETIS